MELEFGDAHFNVIEILKVLGNYTDTQAFLRVNSKVFWFFFFFLLQPLSLLTWNPLEKNFL